MTNTLQVISIPDPRHQMLLVITKSKHVLLLYPCKHPSGLCCGELITDTAPAGGGAADSPPSWESSRARLGLWRCSDMNQGLSHDGCAVVSKHPAKCRCSQPLYKQPLIHCHVWLMIIRPLKPDIPHPLCCESPRWAYYQARLLIRAWEILVTVDESGGFFDADANRQEGRHMLGCPPRWHWERPADTALQLIACPSVVGT